MKMVAEGVRTTGAALALGADTASSCRSRRRWRRCSTAASTSAPALEALMLRRQRAETGNRLKIDRMGFFGRIRESLTRTKQQIVDRFDEIVRVADEPERRSRPVDVDTIEALEELLISADIGVAATDRIIAAVKKPVARRRRAARSGEARDCSPSSPRSTRRSPLALASAASR